MWCFGALAQQGAGRMAGWVYAGVGGGIALAGLHCLLATTAGVRSPALWLQLGGLVLFLALPVLWVVARLSPAPSTGAPRSAGTGAPRDDHRTRGLVICYGIMGFGYILPATFLPVLARGFVGNPHLFGLAWPIFGATADLSTLLVTRLLHDANRLKTWAACQLVMGIGVLLPAVWTSVWSITASALLVGGTFMVITLAGVQEIRARDTARATHLWSAASPPPLRSARLPGR